MNNSTNLLDTPWIPTPEKLLTLREIFNQTDISFISGSPLVKISIFKFLQAVVQAACTPNDDAEWNLLSSNSFQELRKRINNYLDLHHDDFYLNGEHPFLQLNSVKEASSANLGILIPYVCSGDNNVVITEYQTMRGKMSDTEKIVGLLVLQNFGFGGKGKADRSFSIDKSGNKKTILGGPALGTYGYLHTFYKAETLIESLWLNLFTKKDIEKSNFKGKIGTPPWENMPKSESDSRAKEYTNTLMGFLVPLSRYCLLDGDEIHITSGIPYLEISSGTFDPSVTIYRDDKNKTKALLVNPDKKPWRDLSSILSAFTTTSKHTCLQISLPLERISKLNTNIMIWSSGLKISANSGEQFFGKDDCFVDSCFMIQDFGNIDESLKRFSNEVLSLENVVSKRLYGCIKRYYSDLKVENDSLIHSKMRIFWEFCEHHAQELINTCYSNEFEENITRIRQKFAKIALSVYDNSCPNVSARQMCTWIKHRKEYHDYITGDK